MMKKRWFWIGLAAVVAAGGIAWASRSDESPTVTTKVLTPMRVEQTVSCNGVVEATDGIGVFAPVTCHIKEVRVAVGQRVSKGDILAVVDKEATYAASSDKAAQIALAAMDAMLTAPEDGIVVEVDAEIGKALKMGTPCAVIVRPCDLQIRIAIREKDLCTLEEGMSVRVSGDGLAATAYYGTLSEIACAASTDGSVPMVAGVVTFDENQVDDSFRLGLSAKAAVITSVTEEGYVIPYEAVLSDAYGSFIYLFDEGVARLYRVENSIQMPSGLLLTDVALDGVSVILDPDRVSSDGAFVEQVVM